MQSKASSIPARLMRDILASALCVNEHIAEALSSSRTLAILARKPTPIDRQSRSAIPSASPVQASAARTGTGAPARPVAGSRSKLAVLRACQPVPPHRGQRGTNARARPAAAARNANLGYRAPRFLNHCRAKRQGWLPPSLRHRVDPCVSWVNRLRRLVPVSRWTRRARRRCSKIQRFFWCRVSAGHALRLRREYVFLRSWVATPSTGQQRRQGSGLKRNNQTISMKLEGPCW